MRIATAHFICDAMSSGPQWATCNNSVTVDLLNDGQYDSFNTPDGWHIALGTTVDRTVVRCPTHCEWVYDDPDTGRYGHWQDAPAPIARNLS